VSETEASDLTRESTILFDLSIALQRTSPLHAPEAGLFYILDTVVKLFQAAIQSRWYAETRVGALK